MSPEDRGFLIGVLYSAWHLHRGHGEDQYAGELLHQSGSLEVFQRLARKEQYHFKRGFWAQLHREREVKQQ